MKRPTPHIGALIAMPLMVALPLSGLWLTGRLAPHHFEFPPLTHYVAHAPFCWLAFLFMATAIGACCLPFVLKLMRPTPPRPPTSAPRPPSPNLRPPPSDFHVPRPTPHLRRRGFLLSAFQISALLPDLRPPSSFPLWGWAAIAFTAITWIVAWNRFEWASSIQSHTFFPLWLGYIVVINALTWRRKGSCLLTARPLQVLMLFIVSALFWWYFEYLNRFVQNWFYFGVSTFSPARYFGFATPPFATVLPAVLGTEEWLETFPRFRTNLDNWHPVPIRRPRMLAAAWLGAGAVSLFAIGLAPNVLFPMLWLSPLILISALQTLTGASTIFTPLRNGSWQRIVRLAVAGLICGFFWEMWNSHSAAGWVYAVPFVGRFKIFEMPVLGYAGYLPFGLECAVIADLVLKRKEKKW
jgi:hypothetical protein